MEGDILILGRTKFLVDQPRSNYELKDEFLYFRLHRVQYTYFVQTVFCWDSSTWSSLPCCFGAEKNGNNFYVLEISDHRVQYFVVLKIILFVCCIRIWCCRFEWMSVLLLLLILFLLIILLLWFIDPITVTKSIIIIIIFFVIIFSIFVIIFSIIIVCFYCH